MKRIIIIIVGVSASIFLLIQLVPYGRQHTNPAVIHEPDWDSPQTREYAQRACFDCHSHETNWPWYSNVAPVSWLLYRDVERGRRHINFSDWSKIRDPNKIIDAVNQGWMPLPQYLAMHPEAKLSQVEKDAFVSGLQATFNGQ